VALGLRLLSALAWLLAWPAAAEVFAGGGPPSKDCLAVFDLAVTEPAERPNFLSCTDGDASCDLDGAVDGVCHLEIAVCANSTADASCSAGGVDTIVVDHALDNGDPRFDPQFQALQARIDGSIAPPSSVPDHCTLPVVFLIPVEGPRPGNVCRRGKKILRMLSASQPVQGNAYLDRDRLLLLCEPAAGLCDPEIFYDGTFDRIQRQVFDRSCARSGCHDSQSQTGGLLLENPTSFTQLVDVVPNNAAAAASGWKRVTRVDASHGDPETSLLFHKLEGDLPSGFGSRMPFGERRLPGYLRDLVELWILNGAPAEGWVPGTD
jgi:hypothetical protein